MFSKLALFTAIVSAAVFASAMENSCNTGEDTKGRRGATYHVPHSDIHGSPSLSGLDNPLCARPALSRIEGAHAHPPRQLTAHDRREHAPIGRIRNMAAVGRLTSARRFSSGTRAHTSTNDVFPWAAYPGASGGFGASGAARAMSSDFTRAGQASTSAHGPGAQQVCGMRKWRGERGVTLRVVCRMVGKGEDEGMEERAAADCKHAASSGDADGEQGGSCGGEATAMDAVSQSDAAGKSETLRGEGRVVAYHLKIQIHNIIHELTINLSVKSYTTFISRYKISEYPKFTVINASQWAETVATRIELRKVTTRGIPARAPPTADDGHANGHTLTTALTWREVGEEGEEQRATAGRRVDDVLLIPRPTTCHTCHVITSIHHREPPPAHPRLLVSLDPATPARPLILASAGISGIGCLDAPMPKRWSSHRFGSGAVKGGRKPLGYSLPRESEEAHNDDTTRTTDVHDGGGDVATMACVWVRLTESSAPGVSALLSLVGVDVGSITGQVGVKCSPITVIGTGSGSSCTAQPVCCENNSFNGVVALGCSPINAGLCRKFPKCLNIERAVLAAVNTKLCGPNLRGLDIPPDSTITTLCRANKDPLRK
ncbi:hydrophobin-domain-containing protein [Pholiota conissans]|uniref:Hydrophobin-domain-containing protein n=1 Tax=Pholiota conissans TaxID=109636 RepID=A0A9P5YM88_9AGAR|nr:hydrophobin-domain-containing protein [Pholiota conissans]